MRVVTVGALLALQFGTVSPPARAYGITGQFEIDGNLADNSGAGDPIDWATFTGATPIQDASGSTKDDIFGNGSKELDPANWSCVQQKPPGKDDIVSGQIGFRRVSGDQFVYINFFRKDVNGDAHMDFEFNKSSSPVNASCSISKRSQGDILISFDTENGGAIINVRAFTFNAATNTFDAYNLGSNADGAVNIPPAGLSIPLHKNGDFGEAAVNLTDTIGEVQCGEFSGAYMKTRSSTSIDAALKDYTKPVKINPDNCPASSLAKAVRNVTTNGTFGTTATASPGDTLEYRLTYTNTGPGTANNVVIADTIQPKQTFLSCSQAPPCTTAGNPVSSVSWSLGNVAPGTRTVTFQVRLDSTGFSAGTTQVKDTATFTTTQEGTKPSNETTTTVTANPNSALAKAVRDVTTGTPFSTSTDAAPGDLIEYRLTYTNSGNANATNVGISDPVPTKTTFVSCSQTPPCTTTGSPVTSVSWTFASVAPGDTKVVTFQVRLDSTGFTQGQTVPITNVAQVCTQTEICKNSPPATVNVKTPNAALAKAVRNVTKNTAFGTTTTAAPGDTLEYRLTLTNPGTAAATNVVVSDVIQQYQTWQSCNPTCTTDGPPVTRVTWTITSVAPGSTTVLTFRVTLDPTFPAGTTAVKDTATVVSDQEPSKNSNETTTTVTAAPISNLAKAVRNVTANGTFGSSTTANPGDTIEYRLTYTNTGNAAASGVVISDPIPAKTTWVSCSPTCTTDGPPVANVSWSIGTVAPGQTVVVTFRVRLDTTGFTPGTTTPVTNVAKVCTTEEGCKDSPPTTVNVQSPKSALAKAVRDVTSNGTFSTATTAQPGDVIEYRLTYTNSGPGTATNVTLSDPIPAHSTYLSCSSACTTNGPPVTSVSWSLGTVNAGQTVLVTFQVTLDSVFPAGTTVITNVGTATTAEETGSTSSNPTTVTVTAQPNLTLGKASDATSTVLEGNQITYTLTYGNTGHAAATNTTITEAVPAGTTFVSCTNGCTVSGSTVTWDVGTVNPGDVGAVTMTVVVNSTVGCTICNVARIASPVQGNGTPVNSNEVCVDALPSASPAGANASGSGQAASVTADLSIPPLLPLLVDEHLGFTSSSQSGVGGDTHEAEVLNVTVPPGGTPTLLLQADVLRSTSTSVVTATPAQARAFSTSETLAVKALGTLVTADVVEGVASATADGGSSSFSSAGSTFKNLKVQGVAMNDVAPNTTLSLGDVTGVGLDVTVALREEVGSTSGPTATTLSGGIYRADLTVNMIHVHVGDGNVKGGKQPIDIIVSQAIAHADFPQTRICNANPTRTVSGHALIAGAWVLDPSILNLAVDYTEIPASGGQQDATADHAYLPDDGSVVDAAAVESFSSGGIGPGSTSSYDFASAGQVCITLTGPACDIGATLVRSVSSSTASALARSSADNFGSDATKLVGLTVAGQTLPDLLGISGTPPPNTPIAIPGVATIVLNEQVCDNGGTLANHCNDGSVAGHTGLTVRAIHVILANPLATPSGTLLEIIVAEAHSDATWK